MEAYRALEAHFGRVGRLAATEDLLHWDLETMMPSGAAAQRAEQIAELRTVIHQLEIDPALDELVARAEHEALDAWQRANLTEIRRRLRHQRALPVDLVAASARAGTTCVTRWREARQQSDFRSLLSDLEQVVALARERAAAKAAAMDVPPYDALLDEYEPDAQALLIDGIFSELASFLPPLIDQVIAEQRRNPAPMPPEGPFAPGAQRALALRVMEALGFDAKRGRLDESTHPFCSGTCDDVRLTTRYSPEDFTRGLMGVIHETGHALYEQGLPAAWRFQPVGRARGMAMHESQSLLVEMQACRSPAFLQWLAPLAREVLGGAGELWSAEHLLRCYRRVERSLIRVDADELTYPLHVILRYRLERALMADALRVADLPEAWNEGMRQLVGVEVPDDRHGCLQDIHWMDGTFGYFPTYTLGAMTAAQLFEAAVQAEPEIPAKIEKGDFSLLLGWLRQHVHCRASSLSGEQLLRQATGRALDVGTYQQNLRRRYLEH